MKKVNFGLGLFAFSALAFATAWYCPFQVPGTYASDVEAEYLSASSVFRENQLVLQANGNMQKDDTVTFQYQDGSIVVYTLDAPHECTPRCVWSSTMPFNPAKPPVIKQGPKPVGNVKQQVGLGLYPGYYMPYMEVTPSVNSQLYQGTVTITQGEPTGGAVSIYYPDMVNGGGGGSGGSGGGGSGGMNCHGDCPPIEVL